jgi:hypothetical protein
MPYNGYYDHYPDGKTPWGAIIAVILIVIGFVGLLSKIPPPKHQLLQEGKITEEEYCDSYKNSFSAPLRCYKYFGVEAGGTTGGKNPHILLVPK